MQVAIVNHVRFIPPDKEGNNGPESRTYHLGIDFWLAEGTPVHAIFDGEIFTATNDAGFKEYGGLIILKHNENNLTFYTLHGHLSVASIQVFKVGDKVKKGDCIGHLGSPEENGAWAPHLHFQLMLSTFLLIFLELLMQISWKYGKVSAQTPIFCSRIKT